MIKLTLIIVVVSYLLGSIPFGYLLVRIFRGQDVRQTGSGNIGATNVARTGSKGLAIATLLLDALKGYAAVHFAFWLTERHRFEPGLPASIYDQTSQVIDARTIFLLAALAAFCAILGHMFPVWLRFKGGKGVATAVGAFAALAPRAMLSSLSSCSLLLLPSPVTSRWAAWLRRRRFRYSCGGSARPSARPLRSCC